MLPGAHNVHGYWPAVWALHHLVGYWAILITCPYRYGLWEIWDVQALGRQWMVWYAALIHPAS
jgi:hypothetical protein